MIPGYQNLVHCGYTQPQRSSSVTQLLQLVGGCSVCDRELLNFLIEYEAVHVQPYIGLNIARTRK